MVMTSDHIPAPRLLPNFIILISGTSAAGMLSFLYLPCPLAAASTLLSVLMVAGADVDARTFLLPDIVTYGAIISGVLAAPLLDPWQSPSQSIGTAILRAAITALLLGLLRKAYVGLRKTEGLGFGDVKLAGAAGAWLPVEAIPICFGLASIAALMSVLIRGGQDNLDELKLPFGTFLCPALWFVFFLTSLSN